MRIKERVVEQTRLPVGCSRCKVPTDKVQSKVGGVGSKRKIEQTWDCEEEEARDADDRRLTKEDEESREGGMKRGPDSGRQPTPVDAVWCLSRNEAGGRRWGPGMGEGRNERGRQGRHNGNKK